MHTVVNRDIIYRYLGGEYIILCVHVWVHTRGKLTVVPLNSRAPVRDMQVLSLESDHH